MAVTLVAKFVCQLIEFGEFGTLVEHPGDLLHEFLLIVVVQVLERSVVFAGVSAQEFVKTLRHGFAIVGILIQLWKEVSLYDFLNFAVIFIFFELFLFGTRS